MQEESKKDEAVHEENGKESENMWKRIRSRAGGLWERNRTRIAIVAVGALGFVAGTNYWVFRSMVRFAGNSFHTPGSSIGHSSGISLFRDGCKLYPQDPVCIADRKLPFGESLEARAEGCFVMRNSAVPAPGNLDLPFECRSLGPMDVMDIEDLRKGPNEDPKLVIQVPPGIRPYFEKAKTRVSVRSALVTYLIVAKANGEACEDVMKEPSLAPIIQDLGPSFDNGLTEDERKTAGEMLSFYNAIISLLGEQRNEIRDRIAKECAGYADKPIVPVRCLILSPNPTPPTAPTHL